MPAGTDTVALGADGTVQQLAVAGSTGAIQGDAHRVTDNSNIPNNFHQGKKKKQTKTNKQNKQTNKNPQPTQKLQTNRQQKCPVFPLQLTAH